jgi:bifunctional ADP-heptose synthase (sugar kinase/adenylyltransferase)
MHENLDSILEQHLTRQQRLWNILLIGDTCVDKYVYGTIDRLSPEAPVPVFVPQREETHRGMAGNVEENLRVLGCGVNLLTVGSSTKTRYIDARSHQHIMRLDDDAQSESIVLDTVIPPVYDAVVISDYNKGCVSYELVEEISRTYLGPVFIDTKKTDLARLGRAVVKINAQEYAQAKTLPDADKLIVTHGKNGATWNSKSYAAPSIEVSDVCGAGDTFLAALVFEYLNTRSLDAAIVYATQAAAVTVKHVGVYAPTKEEINEIRRLC